MSGSKPCAATSVSRGPTDHDEERALAGRRERLGEAADQVLRGLQPHRNADQCLVDGGGPPGAHTPRESELWHDFAAAAPLSEVPDGIVLVSQPGQTRGHAAYAIDTRERWLFHVGDAFYHHGQIDGYGGAPLSLTLMERLIVHDRKRV